MSKSVTIQIGNSDDKLSQAEWSLYWDKINQWVALWGTEFHFTGYSNPTAMWQNAAWCFDIKEDDIPNLKKYLAETARLYQQDSIAWLEGETEFIEAKQPTASYRTMTKEEYAAEMEKS